MPTTRLAAWGSVALGTSPGSSRVSTMSTTHLTRFLGALVVATTCVAPVSLLAKTLGESKGSSPDSHTTMSDGVMSDAHGAHGKRELAPAKVSGHSIYQLEPDWRDENDNIVSIGSLRGQPVVMVMIYTSCQYVCPPNRDPQPKRKDT